MKLKNILVPAITILVTAAVLFGVASCTAGIRAENIQKEHIYMMQTLLPGSENFVIEPYTGEDANVRSVHKAENGFVVETASYGYAGEITMLVGVNNAGKVTGVVVRDMAETPGLGMNALYDHVFLSQFLNSSGSFAIAAPADAVSFATGEATETEDEVTVDGITGATVTSKAVARCINSAVAVVTGADAASAATSWGG